MSEPEKYLPMNRTELIARCEALEAALTPSADTKAAYIAEHQIEVEAMDEDGDSCTEMVTIPWTTIKDIMAMILKRANSAPETTGKPLPQAHSKSEQRRFEHQGIPHQPFDPDRAGKQGD